jgi:hypothetical protein
MVELEDMLREEAWRKELEIGNNGIGNTSTLVTLNMIG